MNRINPLYVGVLLSFVIIFLLFKLSGAKSDFQEAKEAYTKTSKIAINLSGLKGTYANKKKLQASLRRILALSAIRQANISKDEKKSSVKLSSQSMDKKALNVLMGKLLNGSYNITSMKIKRLSKERVSFKMEIKW
jgi:hypothetical protein